MSILDNAIASIELGVEDYETNNPKRLISAVRNFYAGVLLLFKHKLVLLSPGNNESLLKKQILPVRDNGQIVWKGQSKNTVEYRQIKERFESLDIQVDWKKLERAQSYRNDIEHYYDTNQTRPEVVQQYISDCFIIICEFIRTQLNKDPKNLFTPSIWETLIQESQVYEAEKDRCSNALDSLIWENDAVLRLREDFVCTNCGSDLIEPQNSPTKKASDINFRCRICNKSWNYVQLVDAICDNELKDSYRRIADGGDSAIAYCPECNQESYHTSYLMCLHCGVQGPFICSDCGSEVPDCELQLYSMEGVCGWCYQVRMKND